MMIDTTDKNKDFSTKKFVYYQDELKEIWRHNLAATKSVVLQAEVEDADEQLPLRYWDLQ